MYPICGVLFEKLFKCASVTTVLPRWRKRWRGRGALLEWCWKGKSEVRWTKSSQLPLCPPQIPREQLWDWTRASALTDWLRIGVSSLSSGVEFWWSRRQPAFSKICDLVVPASQTGRDSLFSLLGLFLHPLLRASSKSTKESLEERGLRDGEINS